MPAKPQPEQQAPPVQRLRVRYAKRGRARFTSHRDFGRAFERALRRAGIPMAYSSGFSPHPRISYANASPTGAATESEYLEIGLAAECDPAKVQMALDNALPPGLDVLAVVEAEGQGLAEQLTASRWTIDFTDAPPGQLQAAADAFLAAAEVPVERMTKNGLRTFDARGPVVSLSAEGDQRLVLVNEHGVPLVRPDDVVTALRRLVPELTAEVRVVTRTAQGVLVDGDVRDPFGNRV